MFKILGRMIQAVTIDYLEEGQDDDVDRQIEDIPKMTDKQLAEFLEFAILNPDVVQRKDRDW